MEVCTITKIFQIKMYYLPHKQAFKILQNHGPYIYVALNNKKIDSEVMSLYTCFIIFQMR